MYIQEPDDTASIEADVSPGEAAFGKCAGGSGRPRYPLLPAGRCSQACVATVSRVIGAARRPQEGDLPVGRCFRTGRGASSSQRAVLRLLRPVTSRSRMTPQHEADVSPGEQRLGSVHRRQWPSRYPFPSRSFFFPPPVQRRRPWGVVPNPACGRPDVYKKTLFVTKREF